jgi:large subunit ribosomal protein L35
MKKNKSHKSSLKRIRLTSTGLVRHNRAFGKHLRSSKSSKRLRRLRTDKTMSNPEAKRLEKLLFRRLRGRDQARAVLRRNPNPTERKKAQAEARAARVKAGLKYGVKSSK